VTSPVSVTPPDDDGTMTTSEPPLQHLVRLPGHAHNTDSWRWIRRDSIIGLRVARRVVEKGTHHYWSIDLDLLGADSHQVGTFSSFKLAQAWVRETLGWELGEIESWN
jgi:hypothetical protein